MKYSNLSKLFFGLIATTLVATTTANAAAPTSVGLGALSRFVGTGPVGLTPGAKGGEIALGDFNCDGKKDVIIGSQDEYGSIFIKFGGSTISGTHTIDYAGTDFDVTITGELDEGIGRQVVALDVNGDGCDDIVSLGGEFVEDTAASLYTYLGSLSWSGAYTNSPSVYANKLSTSEISGEYYTLINLGAINDTVDSYVAVCSNINNNCLVLSATDLVVNSQLSIEDRASYEFIANVYNPMIISQDVNNDGVQDLVVSNLSSYTTDSIHIFFGPLSSRGTTTFDVSSGTTASGADIVITDTNAASGTFGESVKAKDINGDGHADLMIGSPSETSGAANAGRIHVLSGASLSSLFTGSSISIANDLVTSSTDYNYTDVDHFFYSGDAASSRLGQAFNYEFGGDLNGDGQPDALIGASEYANGNLTGRHYVVYGGAFNTAFGQDIVLSSTASQNTGYNANKYLNGAANGDKLSSNTVVGDVNGDGLDDLLVAASGVNAGAGVTYIVNGAVTDLDGDGVASASDTNGDGVYETLDCNDNDATILPQTFYLDSDNDGYGDAAETIQACGNQPAGYVTDNTDCDDTLNASHPGAVEIGDGLDNDCDLTFDEGLVIPRITNASLNMTKGVPFRVNYRITNSSGVSNLTAKIYIVNVLASQENIIATTGGAITNDNMTFTIPAGAPSGNYVMHLKVYDQTTGQYFTKHTKSCKIL